MITRIFLAVLIALPASRTTEFVLFVENEKGSQLRTAIVSYTKGDTSVDLVAAVHVGERSYYEELQRRFKAYEAVLYEMVGEQGGGRPSDPGLRAIGGFQQWLKTALELEFQLEIVDYRQANFVHADLDVDTYLKLSKERGESFTTLFFRLMQHEAAKQKRGQANQVTLFHLIRLLLSEDRARDMKVMLGKQLQDVEGIAAGLEGENGSVILSGRNSRAFEVLRRTLLSGRKKIAIFYGAAHLPDMEHRLIKMGFTKSKSDWLVAWDMPLPLAPEVSPVGK